MHLPLKSGVLVPALMLLPNLLWLLLPPASTGRGAEVPLALTVAENIGRVAVLLLPCFYTLTLRNRLAALVLALAALALLLYYAAWLRYFTGGRTAALLGAPLLGLPLPLAVAPALFLLLSAYLLSSWPVFVAALCFAAAHIYVSALTL